MNKNQISRDEMTCKERLINSITGGEVDRIAWSPFLAYYWDYIPKDIQRKGQEIYLKELGADPLLRGFHQLFQKSYKNCNIRTHKSGNYKFTIYETPIGNIQEGYTYVKSSNTWFLTEHPVKVIEDLDILMYLFNDMILTEDYTTFQEDYDKLGQKGLYLPIIGTESKTSFQSLVEHWIGTENLVYMIYDEPGKIDECLDLMRKRSYETVNISVKSKAEGFIFFEDSSTTNISPQMFEKYVTPEINEWGEIIHANNKLLVHHACGHIYDLIPLMAKTNIDAIESISPPPTGNIELFQAKEMLKNTSIALIGGIEPTVLLNSSKEHLKEYVNKLLLDMKNSRFILANSDSCPPGVEIEKFKFISRIVKSATNDKI